MQVFSIWNPVADDDDNFIALNFNAVSRSVFG